jgi:hypothetical protein
METTAHGNIDQAVLAGERDGRFGTVSRQGKESCAHAATQDHCNYITHVHIDNPPYRTL